MRDICQKNKLLFQAKKTSKNLYAPKKRRMLIKTVDTNHVE
jgi:hypothetical protein